jgi:MobA-like NTP transferase domain
VSGAPRKCALSARGTRDRLMATEADIRAIALSEVTAVVLAGGSSQRFAPDKLAEQVDGQPLLDQALASLPEQVAAVIVVGAVREVARSVIFTSEEPARAAHLFNSPCECFDPRLAPRRSQPLHG